MKRREFIAGLSGAAAWPLVARGQQNDRARRVGALLGYQGGDELAEARIATFPKSYVLDVARARASATCTI